MPGMVSSSDRKSKADKLISHTHRYGHLELSSWIGILPSRRIKAVEYQHEICQKKENMEKDDIINLLSNEMFILKRECNSHFPSNLRISILNGNLI